MKKFYATAVMTAMLVERYIATIPMLQETIHKTVLRFLYL